MLMRSTTPDSRTRLPNISMPMRAVEAGAMMAQISVTMMGKTMRVVREMTRELYGMRLRRSLRVVSSLITGG